MKFEPPVLWSGLIPVSRMWWVVVPLVLGVIPVQAASLSVADPYSMFIFGNASYSNVELEGRIAVGGDAELTNFGLGSGFQNEPQSAGVTLVTGGHLNYQGGVVRYGSVVYGGVLTGSVDAPNGTASQGTPLDFVGARNTLLSASQYWASLPATGQTISAYGGVQLVGTDANLNVFQVSGSMLSQSWGLVIDVPAGASVLVNVDGEVNRLENMGFQFSDVNGDGTGVTTKQNVLYHFAQSTSLTIRSVTVEGSVLAPHAAVDFSNGKIEGQLIAESLSGSSGQATHLPFLGVMPDPSPDSQVPEPSVAGLLLWGVWASMRRRRK